MRYRQPQNGPARIDRANPLMAGALAVVDWQRRNLVTGVPLRSSSTATNPTVTTAGVAANLNGGWLATEVLPAVGTAQFLEFWVGYPGSIRSQAYGGPYADFITGSSVNNTGIYQARGAAGNSWGCTNNWDTGNQFVDAGTVLPVGALCVLVAIYKGSTIEFWANGQLVRTATSTAISFVAASMIVGSLIEDTGYWPTYSGMVMAGRIRACWTPQQVASFSANPNQIYAPQRVLLAGAAAAGTTHTSTGALVASTASIAGTAARQIQHAASGALAGSTAAVAGTANRLAVHAVSGALAASAATVTGAASRLIAHAASGALASGAASVAGTATRAITHTSSGALVAGSAVASGAASRSITGSFHAGTGSLVAASSSLAGTANRFAVHPATGSLTAGAAAIAGTAAHLVLHSSSGALQAGLAQISGTSSHVRAHVASGALVASPAQISGTNGKGGAPGYGDKAKRKFTVRRGDQLLVFSTANAALRALDQIDPEQPLPKKQAKQIEAAIAELVATEKPEQRIDIAEIKETAEAMGEKAKVEAMLQQKNYEAMTRLYAELVQQQDEEDIELLLMAV